jgi:SAM-dependent methyltransferase
MDIREMHQQNRKGWNEGAEHYATLIERDIEFLRNGGKNFEPPEFRYLHDLASWCKRAIHLQCAGGRDTLSLWNQGAAEVIGVDISDGMIECARRKAEALNAPAQCFRGDLRDTPHELDGTADLVYTGRGALCWIMDITAWATVPARLLKPGGRLYVYDGHPIAWIFDLNASELKLDPEYGNYFDDRVHAGQGWPDTYIGDLGKAAEEHEKKYERQWNLGQIVNALVDAGLRVERLEEHPEPFWDQFPNLPPDVVRRIPNSFSLLMRKD